MYQLMLRSVGKPGTLVMAKKVPEKAILWKMGMAKVGKNTDGMRRTLRIARADKAFALRSVERSVSGCEEVSTDDVIVLPPFWRA